MLTLLGWSCSDVADECADWSLEADCSASWTLGPPWSPHPPPQALRTGAEPEPEPCSAFWFVSFLLPAADLADESLTCLTEPLSPSLKIRTGMLTLLGWSCLELAEESADCLLPASCFAVWTPPPD